MEQPKTNRKDDLRKRIEEVLKSRGTSAGDLSNMPADAILEEISTYHQELEFQNIELMRISQELEASEQHFEELFNHAPVGYVLFNSQNAIRAANSMFASMLGEDSKELEGKSLTHFIHPNYQDELYLLIQKLSKGKIVSGIDLVFCGKQGDISARIECNKTQQNGDKLFRMAVMDVSKEKRAENKLRRSEENLRCNEQHLKEQNEEYYALNEELTQANDELRLTSLELDKQRYEKQLILDSISDMVMLHDLDFNIVWVNRAAADSVGKKFDQIVGKPCYDNFGEDATVCNDCPLVKTRKTGKPSNTIKERHDGRIWNIKAFPTYNHNDEMVGIVETMNDITERVRDKESLEKLAYRLSSVIEGTNVATWEWNVQTGETTFNERWADILGYTLQEIAPVSIETWERFTHPDDLPKSFEILEKHFSGESDYYEVEFRMKHKDGSWVWVLDKGKVKTWTGDGKPLLMYGTHTDITNRKQTEQNLENRNHFIQTVLDNLPIGVALNTINDGEAVYINKKFQEIYGWSEEEIKDINSFFHKVYPDEAYRNELMGRVMADIQSGDPARMHWENMRVTRSDGSIGIINAVNIPLIDQNTMVSTVMDVTEQRMAEETLEKERMMLRTLIDVIPDSIYVKDMNCRKLVSNRANYQNLGFDREEDILGKNDFDVLSREVAQLFFDDDQRVLKRGESIVNKEEKVVRPSGDIVWQLTSKVPLYNQAGEIVGLVGVGRNITERKYADEALKQSEERIKSIFRVAPTGIGVVKNRVITEVNPTLCQMTGYSAEELEGQSARMLYPTQEDFEYVGREKYQQIAEKGTGTLETRWKRKDGAIIHVLLSSTPIVENDHAQGVTFTALDITQRKHNELVMQVRIELMEFAEGHTLAQLLKETLAQAEKLTNSQIGFYHFIDQKSSTINLNQWSERTEKEFCNVKESIKMHYPIADAGVWVDCIKKRRPVIHNDYGSLTHRKGMPKGHAPLTRELTVPVVRNKQVKAVLGIGNKESDYNQGDVLIISTLADLVWDIAEKKMAQQAILESEQRLKEQNEEYLALNEELTESNERIRRINTQLYIAREKAEESDRLKSAFLANMSHEIRTPMNAIIGFSEFLLKPDLPSQKKEYFTYVLNSSCHQLLNIVDDVIDISKIETGQMIVHNEETSINNVVSGVTSIFLPKANEAGLSLKVNCGIHDENDRVITDSTKLNQILTNLVSNALKFTEEGEVEIGYYLKESYLQFYVRDTGIGISPNHFSLIFERFRQIETEDSRKYGGTGLGLPICKALVEMQGGSIWVESQVGKGSSFCFSIPFIPAKESPKNGEVEFNDYSRFNGKVILIAEDEDTNYLLVEEYIKEIGAIPIHAHDGVEAVHLFKENPQIDIILMDIKMPRMNGDEAAQAIKAIRKDVPIIALTAFAMAGDKKKFMEAGCNDYLSKPLNKNELLRIMAEHLK